MEKINLKIYTNFLSAILDYQIIINKERCRKVYEFDNYVISESGRIYRIKPYTEKEQLAYKNNPNINYFRESDYSKRQTKTHCKVKLRDSLGKYKFRLPAYLVALSFGVIPKDYLKNKYELVYKDKNSDNLHFTNLQFVEKDKKQIKLTLEDIVHIRRLISLQTPSKHIAEVYGVSDTLIYKIKSGQCWNDGKLLIKPKSNPIKIKDHIINRILTRFEHIALSDKNLRKPFSIKRDGKNPKNNYVIGFVQNYKFKRVYSEITKAKYIVNKLNSYFYPDINVKQ